MSGQTAAFLDGLSDEQHIAALTTADPVLILAGAGSGKTRTLVGRFIHLVTPTQAGGLGADPSSIMMVTFTNKAAKEMRERIAPVLEEIRGRYPSVRGGDPWVGTFHGLSLRILRVESARAGLGKTFSIFDDSDASSLVKDVVENMGIEMFDEDEFFKDLEFAKARLLGHDLLAMRKEDIETTLADGKELDPIQRRWRVVVDHFQSERFIEIYGAYQRALEDQNAVDFSDLINKITTLFRENPDIRKSWASSFRHFMVDEVQDMNRSQLFWMNAFTDGGRETLLDDHDSMNEYAEAHAGGHEVNGFRVRAFPRPTIALVGDDDQSIYGFRGSEVEIMRGMDKHFPGLVTRFLKESYRCQPAILGGANAIIGNNTDRFGKDLVPADPDRAQTPIRLERSFKADGEIAEIARRARQHITDGHKPSEFAVLLRTRDLAKFVAKSLRELGLPVTEGKASDIRKTVEVRDAMAFAAYLCNPDDETRLRRIINKPARGLGPTSIGVVNANARLKNISFIDELRSIMNDKIDLPDEGTPYKTAFRKNCKAFGQLVVDLRAAVRSAPNAKQAFQVILDTTGYLADLKQGALSAAGHRPSPETDAMEPRAFLTHLVEISDEKRTARSGTDATNDELDHENLVDDAGRISEKARRIGNLSLLMAQAEPFETLEDFLQDAMLEMAAAEEAAGIQVLTMHASKGLEFDHVTLPFWIDGVMPHGRAVDEGEKEIEEERRLGYVALTRGRETVTISTSKVTGNVTAIRSKGRLNESRFLPEILAAGPTVIGEYARAENGYMKPMGKTTGSGARPKAPPPAPRAPDPFFARVEKRGRDAPAATPRQPDASAPADMPPPPPLDPGYFASQEQDWAEMGQHEEQGDPQWELDHF